ILLFERKHARTEPSTLVKLRGFNGGIQSLLTLFGAGVQSRLVLSECVGHRLSVIKQCLIHGSDYALGSTSQDLHLTGSALGFIVEEKDVCDDGILTAVEGCAAIHGHSTPPPAGWVAAIHRGSLSGPRVLGSLC